MSTYLLLEVSTILLIDEYQVEIVSRAELLVYITKGRGQLEPSQKQPYWYSFPSDRSTIHYFEFGNRLGFVVLVRWSACCFSSNDGELHVLYFYSNEQEINLANDHILQVVSYGRRAAILSDGT